MREHSVYCVDCDKLVDKHEHDFGHKARWEHD